jgi:cell division transport system permease protein
MFIVEAVLRETRLNLRGKHSSIMVTLLMVSFSFVVFDTFLVDTWNLESLLREEQEAVGIEVFLDNGLSEEDGRQLGDVLTGMEGIRSVYYVSHAEAEAVFRAEFPDQGEMLDILSERFLLPASLQIGLHPDYRDAESVERLALTIMGMEGVDDVIYGEEYLPGLTSTVRALGRLVLFAGLILVVSICLVVSSTIRLAVTRRALTVEIMSIVGAPGWFLRMPFLLEGIGLGLAGSAGGILLAAVVSAILSPTVPHTFMPASWVLGVLALGAAVGCAGSWMGLVSGIPRPRS